MRWQTATGSMARPVVAGGVQAPARPSTSAIFLPATDIRNACQSPSTTGIGLSSIPSSPCCSGIASHRRCSSRRGCAPRIKFLVPGAPAVRRARHVGPPQLHCWALTRPELWPVQPASICKAMPVDEHRIAPADISRAQRPPHAENVTASELRALADSGLVALGAHTLSHPILRNETASCSEDEIVRSVSELSSLVGRQVRYFAYPNGLPGSISPSVRKYISAKAGVDLAFSTESRG